MESNLNSISQQNMWSTEGAMHRTHSYDDLPSVDTTHSTGGAMRKSYSYGDLPSVDTTTHSTGGAMRKSYSYGDLYSMKTEYTSGMIAFGWACLSVAHQIEKFKDCLAKGTLVEGNVEEIAQSTDMHPPKTAERTFCLFVFLDWIMGKILDLFRRKKVDLADNKALVPNEKMTIPSRKFSAEEESSPEDWVLVGANSTDVIKCFASDA